MKRKLAQNLGGVAQGFASRPQESALRKDTPRSNEARGDEIKVTRCFVQNSKKAGSPRGNLEARLIGRRDPRDPREPRVIQEELEDKENLPPGSR